MNDWPEATSDQDRVAYAEALERLQARKVPETIDQVLSQESKPAFPYYRIMAAASVVLLMGWGWFLLKPAPSPQALFAAYYDPAELLSGRERGDAAGEQIIVLYENGAYDQLIEQMESATEQKTEWLLYYGVALLATDRESEATDAFLEFVESPLLDAPKGYWYLGLTYLKTGDQAQALEAFQLLIKSGSKFKQKEAQELIDALD